MPTGYTHDIKDGISFEAFVMNCARAFGACVTLRDEPGGGDAIPNVFEPSNYHSDKVAELTRELDVILALSPDACKARADEEWQQAEERRIERTKERSALLAQYEAMLAKVKSWKPPTTEHIGLKTFMQEQIETSIKFDCDGGSFDIPRPKLTGTRWAEQKIAQLRQGIAYHKTKHAEEIERTNGRTAWVKALRQSLSQP